MTNEKFEDPFVDLDEDKSTMDKDQHVINLVIICYLWDGTSFDAVIRNPYSIIIICYVSLFFLSCFYNKIFYQ